MSKKIFFVPGLLILVAVGVVFYLSRSWQKPISPIVNDKTSGKVVDLGTLKKYSDPSGFEFSYPDKLKLTHQKTDDETSYADLKLSSDKMTGQLSLQVNDTDYSDIDEYLLEKNASSAASAKKIKLADIDAREIMSDNEESIFGLDQGVIFKIGVDFGQDKTYWQEVKNTLIKNFAFIIPTVQPDSGQQSGGEGSDIIDEGEEIVQ